MARWTFTDPALGLTFRMKINPFRGGSLSRGHNITTASTLRGQTIIQQGRPKRRTTETEGVIYTTEALAVLTSARNHVRQLKLTDDLGREQWVIIDRLESRLDPRQHHPDRCVVTMQLSELDYA